MSDTELTILRESQRLLDQTLAMLDEQMARVAGLNGPNGAMIAEHWFRSEIRKALAPLTASIARLESRPLPSPTPLQPSQQYEKALLQSIGKFVREEIDRRVTKRLDALESKMANWRYCGVWSAGKYLEGNFVTSEGSLFVCLWDTEAKPGTDSSWQLCCKRGKDGRDGKDTADNVRRLATMQRA